MVRSPSGCQHREYALGIEIFNWERVLMRFSLAVQTLILLVVIGGIAIAQETPQPSVIQEEVIVSATKTGEDPVEIPAGTSIISGEELRRTGAKTVAEAIQDVVGID